MDVVTIWFQRKSFTIDRRNAAFDVVQIIRHWSVSPFLQNRYFNRCYFKKHRYHYFRFVHFTIVCSDSRKILNIHGIECWYFCKGFVFIKWFVFFFFFNWCDRICIKLDELHACFAFTCKYFRAFGPNSLEKFVIQLLELWRNEIEVLRSSNVQIYFRAGSNLKLVKF